MFIEERTEKIRVVVKGTSYGCGSEQVRKNTVKQLKN